jgi:2-dehydro-3-deoxyphosphogluconate aldolase/(4S)-4-hydroxy-2-oxoglutarate aldolase
MSHLRDQLKGHRVIPVVTITDESLALPLGEALLEGGIGVIEVTLRHKAGIPAIRKLREKLPEMKVGAGTVTTSLLLQQAHLSGAQFFVSPGLSSVLRESLGGLAFLPGIATPSEAMEAMLHDLTMLKFFPAASVGGIEMLKHLGSVFPELAFCPTGGITEKTMPDYLKLKNVFAVGGSWLTPANLIEAGDWKAITEIARRSADAAAQATA